MEEAIDTLKLPYSYEITTNDPKKVAARKQLGSMSLEVLLTMRDELFSAGAQEWLRYEALRDNGSTGDSGAQVSS